MVDMRKRLPTTQSILQVYSVIVVMLAGWTITAFLWKLSAWLLILNVGEIFTIFSYAMVVNLFESLIVLLLLLAACFLLPARVLRDEFTVRGTMLAAGLIGSMIAFVRSDMQFGIESGVTLLIGPLIVILLTVFLLGFSLKTPFVSSSILWISDRFTVFLFILLPLFAILLTYVIFRNMG
jgi:hypothetical protein